MTTIQIYKPYVFLRCRKCGRKTDHTLIKAATTEEGETEETYERHECGETKKIFELASMMQLHSSPLSRQTITRKGKPSGARTLIASVHAILNSTLTIGVFNLVIACFLSLVFCQPSCFIIVKNLLQIFRTRA